MDDLLGALRQSLREAQVGGAAPARRSRNLESTLEVVQEAMEGSVPLEDGLLAIRQQRERLQKAQEDLENNTRGTPMGGTPYALVERIRQLYAANGGALDELESALSRGDRARVDAAGARLRGITDEMFECQDAWQAEVDLIERQAGGMVIVPEQYARLYEACDQMARGSIPQARWRQVLESVRAELVQTRQNVEGGLANMGPQLAEDGYCQGLADNVRKGLDESLEGLERMRGYAVSGDPDELNQGWGRLVEGTVRVQKAMHTLSAGQAGRGDAVILEDED